MTPVPRHEPEERERRIRAAAEAISYCMPATFDDPEQRRSRVAAEAALDAADEAVPMVSEEHHRLIQEAWDREVESANEARAALQAMQARWSGMVQRSKQHVERARVRAEQAEVAARDLYGALDDFLGGKHEHDGAYQHLRDVLARHPAFSPPPEGDGG